MNIKKKKRRNVSKSCAIIKNISKMGRTIKHLAISVKFSKL